MKKYRILYIAFLACLWCLATGSDPAEAVPLKRNFAVKSGRVFALANSRKIKCAVIRGNVFPVISVKRGRLEKLHARKIYSLKAALKSLSGNRAKPLRRRLLKLKEARAKYLHLCQEAVKDSSGSNSSASHVSPGSSGSSSFNGNPESSSSVSPAPPGYAASITQFGITWVFDKPYPAGQYINGDWWVIGPVTIAAIDPLAVHSDTAVGNDGQTHSCSRLEHCEPYLPAPLDGMHDYVAYCVSSLCRYSAARHGSQINPTTAAQGYDSRDRFTYNHSANAALSLPITLQPAQSLVSTKSWTMGDGGFNGAMKGTTITHQRDSVSPDSLRQIVSQESWSWLAPGNIVLWDRNGVAELRWVVSVSDNTVTVNADLTPGGGKVAVGARLFAPYLQAAAVLTSVSAQPPPDAFRPSPYGDVKLSYQAGTLRWERLPSLPPVASPPTLESMASKYEKFRLDQIGTYSAVSYLVPSDAQYYYGAVTALENGDAALRLCLDDSNEEKQTLLVRYIQYGIDLHGAARTGTRWRANGGLAMGRKLPILFAGLMLDDAEMLAIGADYPATSDKFAEDAQKWYVNEDDLTRPLRIRHSGTARGGTLDTIILAENHPAHYPADVVDNRIHLIAGTGAGQTRVATDYAYSSTKTATVSSPWDIAPDSTTIYEVRGYEADMIGMPEYGIRHFGEYPNLSPEDNPSIIGPYRIINSNAQVGMAVAARILGLKAVWNHNAFFDYQERYFRITSPGGAYSPRPSGYRSGFAERMYEAYADQFE